MTQHTTAQNLSPNRSLQEIFEDVVQTAEHRISQIKELVRNVYATLGEDLSENNRHDLRTGLDVLIKSFTSLQKQAEQPELVLAMTGTTSSGKSTLANFLIGEELLPSAVREMSAGLVKVKHGYKRKLTIPQTKGATWKTGTWENVTATEVSKRLKDTMNDFRQAEDEDDDEEIEPVVFEIEWPIRLAERKKELGLPEGTQVTILDLPGLKVVNDERNGPVIRRDIAKAFCLIAYNAEEVDEQKQENLLNQVVNQVMALSCAKDEEKKTEANQRQGYVSDLSRMLFLLNRIDAFYRHDDAGEQLEKFKGEVTNQLRGELKRVLPTRDDVVDFIEKIELVQICSLPAFWAVALDRLWEKPDKQVEIIKSIDSKKEILPKNEKGKNWFREFFLDWEGLQEAPKEYSKEKRHAIIKKLIDDTLKGSRANDFEQRLTTCIKDKLPNIVIGAPCNLYSQKEKDLLNTLSRLCENHLVRTKEEAEKKQEALEKAKTKIQEMLEDLKTLFTPIKDDCNQYMENKINFSEVSVELTKHLGTVEEKIKKEILVNVLIETPQKTLIETPNILFSYVQRLIEGEKNPEPAWPFNNSPMVERLKAAVESCRQTTAFDLLREKGGLLQSEYNDQVKNSHEKLATFLKDLNETLQAGMNTMLQECSKNIHQSFLECADILQQQMRECCQNEEALKEFFRLIYLFDQQLELQKPKNIRLNETFVLEDLAFETKTVSYEVQKNGFWNRLFRKKEIKKIDRQEAYFNTPSLEQISSDIQKGNEELLKQVAKEIVFFLDDFQSQLHKMFSEGVDNYRKAIEESIGEITELTCKKNKQLTQYLENIKTLMDSDVKVLIDKEYDPHEKEI